MTIILIDKHSETFKKLKDMGCTNIEHIKNTNEALKKIKKIEFEEFKIIIDGKLYSKFAEEFYSNINEINVIPNIVIFTENEANFKKENKNVIKEPFFNFCKIEITIENLINFINEDLFNKKFDIEEPPQLTFEKVDQRYKLALHLFYKVLIDFTDIENIHNYTEKLYTKYESNIQLKTLFGPIRGIKNIPIELLSKYYAKAYTFETPFYDDINSALRKNKMEEYLQYIKLLYESIKLKTFPLVKDTRLYRGGKLFNEEIENIEKILNDKKDKNDNLPGLVVFSRTFLSFSKDDKIALSYLQKSKNDNSNLSKVFFKLQKEEDLNYNLATHADIENISFYKSER